MNSNFITEVLIRFCFIVSLIAENNIARMASTSEITKAQLVERILKQAKHLRKHANAEEQFDIASVIWKDNLMQNCTQCFVEVNPDVRADMIIYISCNDGGKCSESWPALIHEAAERLIPVEIGYSSRKVIEEMYTHFTGRNLQTGLRKVDLVLKPIQKLNISHDFSPLTLLSTKRKAKAYLEEDSDADDFDTMLRKIPKSRSETPARDSSFETRDVVKVGSMVTNILVKENLCIKQEVECFGEKGARTSGTKDIVEPFLSSISCTSPLLTTGALLQEDDDDTITRMEDLADVHQHNGNPDVAFTVYNEIFSDSKDMKPICCENVSDNF